MLADCRCAPHFGTCRTGALPDIAVAVSGWCGFPSGFSPTRLYPNFLVLMLMLKVLIMIVISMI
jgi:hypothetical protein